MSGLENLAGRARGGMLYGIGVGPGDARLITLRAAGLIQTVDVVGYFAKRGQAGNARTIAAPLLGVRARAAEELRLEYPVTEEIPTSDAAYRGQIAAFYDRAAGAIRELLGEGKSVGVLGEGDPFFYGSFIHLWRRLEIDIAIEVVPGVTGMSGCWTRANVPITSGNEVLTVLPGTLEEQQLARRLAATDAAVVLKVGRNLHKVRRAAEAAGVLARALYVERATMAQERILPLAEVGDRRGAYFAMVLIPGSGRRP